MIQKSAEIVNLRGNLAKKVLVLDDQPTMCSVIGEIAKSTDDQVNATMFTDPCTALVYALNSKPDLIITDYKMHGMNGAQFVTEIRKHYSMEEVPIIMISVLDDVRYAAYGRGVNAFINKPIKCEDLKFLLAKFLARPQIQGSFKEPVA